MEEFYSLCVENKNIKFNHDKDTKFSNLLSLQTILSS